MTKKEIRYVAALCALFAGLVLFEAYGPKPVDWTQTLSNRDKIPYGTYVLYAMMDTLFPGQKTVEARMPAYNCLRRDTVAPAHYLSISTSTRFDANDVKALLDFAAAGNSVFIASQYMHAKPLFDTLHIRTRDTLKFALHDSLEIWTAFTNPQLGAQRYSFRRAFQNTLFFEFDSLTGDVAVLGRNSLGKPDFIRAGFGGGVFYLHLLPLAFSNYYVLNDTTSDYAFKALSYLSPDRRVIWDGYTGRGHDDEKGVLHVIMDQPALRWTYYIGIWGVLLFVLFGGKRRQRVIPVVKPLQNTTLEFVNVIGNLYFQKQDHQGIARSRIIFFLEHIRSQYHLPAGELDGQFAETLSRKSGYPPKKTQYLIWKIRQAEGAAVITAEDLVTLSDRMEDFLESVNIRQEGSLRRSSQAGDINN